jgi:putative ABC transport system permease protein
MTIQASQRIITDREVHLNAVSPGFFATLGTRVVGGRDFDERDSLAESEGGQRVAIVNEAFVKRYFGGRSPLGVRIGQGSGPDVKPDVEIIGVLANISYRVFARSGSKPTSRAAPKVLRRCQFLCAGSGNSQGSL